MGELGIISQTPGNIATIISGGTRKGIPEKKLDRFWQVDFPENADQPETCVFVKRTQDEVPDLALEGWRVFHNKFSPFANHYVIIPKSCLPKSIGYTLNGIAGIRDSLAMTKSIIQSHRTDMFYGVHQGPLAGQNEPHLHFHCLEPVLFQKNLLATETHLTVIQTKQIKVTVDGVNTGQIYFFPTAHPSPNGLDYLPELISEVISLYAQKFISNQGMPPQYRVSVRINGNGDFLYGTYVPKLNNQGITEDIPPTEGAPYALSWTHEDTYFRLKS